MMTVDGADGTAEDEGDGRWARPFACAEHALEACDAKTAMIGATVTATITAVAWMTTGVTGTTTAFTV